MSKNKFQDQVHGRIAQFQSRRDQLWTMFQDHSSDYVSALRLRQEQLVTLEEATPRMSMYPDLQEIADRTGIVNVEIDGQEFVISCKMVCGAYYGGTWCNFLFGICVSDPTFNTEFGRGTTLISVLPEEIHKKICERISQG